MDSLTFLRGFILKCECDANFVWLVLRDSAGVQPKSKYKNGYNHTNPNCHFY